MINNEEKNENLIFLTDGKEEEEININPKLLYLFNNFLVKENINNFSKKKKSEVKEIMPEYTDIKYQIQRKINDVRDFYGSDPLFKDMQSKNSYAMTLFRKGFKNMFFGPRGIVTRKSIELKKYYKSIEPKFDLNSKIYAGSFDYYDFLSNYNSFFERLKNSRKRILKINGNFSVSNTSLEKLHANYENKKKKEKKNVLYKNNIKEKLSIFSNKSNNTNNDNNDMSSNNLDNKSKTRSNFNINSFLKNNNLLFDKNNEKQKVQNTISSYAINSENIKNNEPSLKKYYRAHKQKFNSNKSKFMNISLQVDEYENLNKIRKNRKEKTEIYSEIRDDTKRLSNITTISHKNKNNDYGNITPLNLYTNLINKSQIKKKHTFILGTPMKIKPKNNKTKFILNESPIKNNKNKIQIENYTTNKTLQFPEERKRKSNHKNNKIKKQIENYTSNKTLKFLDDIKKENQKNNLKSLNAIKTSLKNRIDSSMPKNKKFENSLNKFIANNKKYELKKRDLINQRIKEELTQLKEDMKSTGKFNDMPKNVDFSDVKGFSAKDNYKSKNRLKGASFNLAFSFKSRMETTIPIKDFLNNLDKLKQKQKEKKFLKYIRSSFKKNIKTIHNLTISLDNIKKKYNY